MKKIAIIFSFITSILSADTFTLERADGTPMTGYANFPETESYPIVIAVQNSLCESILPFLHHFQDFADQMGVALVGIEKQGVISAEEIDERAYHQGNYRERRILDHLLLVDALRNQIVHAPGWNGRIIFLGGSEGSLVALQTAPLVPETSAVMLFSAGGGLDPRQEVTTSIESYFKCKGTPQIAISMMLASIGLQLDEMIANPSTDKFFYDYSYRWWASHLTARPVLDSALLLDCPILYVHGVEDELIPIKSADLFVEAFAHAGKTNLTYVRLDGFTHDLFRHDMDAVQDYSARWLQQKL